MIVIVIRVFAATTVVVVLTFGSAFDQVAAFHTGMGVSQSMMPSAPERHVEHDGDARNGCQKLLHDCEGYRKPEAEERDKLAY